MEDVFEEVHKSHMTKEILEGEEKLFKGKNFKKTDMGQFFKK